MSRTDDPWLEWHVGLRDHPKTARLRRRLGVTLPMAVGLVSLMWAWAVRYAPSGDLSRFDADVIADAAGWDDDPGLFVRSLVASGFLDEDLTIHDWDAYVGRLIDRREANARRMQQAREAQKQRRSNGDGSAHVLPDTLSTSGARDAHVQGLPDITLTGPDRTGPDPTPPTPSPHGGEGARQQRRGRRTAPYPSSADDGAPDSLPPLAPPTSEDDARFDRTRERMRSDMSAPNYEALVEPLVLLGRDDRGVLYVQAPASSMLVERIRPMLARALLDVGESAYAAQHVHIVVQSSFSGG